MRRQIKMLLKKPFVLLIVLSFVVNVSSCSPNNDRGEPSLPETIIYEDISFVQSKFPNVKGIKSVKYVYYAIGRSGGIGLQPKTFNGVIQIDDNFAEEIYKKYKWQEREIDLLSFMGDSNSGAILYSDDFDEDIHTSSFVGEFYFNRTDKCLYFFGGY